MKKISTRLLSLLLVVVLLASVVPFGALAEPTERTFTVEFNPVDLSVQVKISAEPGADNETLAAKLNEELNKTFSGTYYDYVINVDDVDDENDRATATGTPKPAKLIVVVRPEKNSNQTVEITEGVHYGSTVKKEDITKAVIGVFDNLDQNYTYAIVDNIVDVTMSDGLVKTINVNVDATEKEEFNVAITVTVMSSSEDDTTDTINMTVLEGTTLSAEDIKAEVAKKYSSDQYEMRAATAPTAAVTANTTATATVLKKTTTPPVERIPSKVTLHHKDSAGNDTTSECTVTEVGDKMTFTPQKVNDYGSKAFLGWSTTENGNVNFPAGKAYTLSKDYPTDLYAIYRSGETDAVTLTVQANYYAGNRNLGSKSITITGLTKSNKAAYVLEENKEYIRKNLIQSNPFTSKVGSFTWSEDFHTKEGGSTDVTNENVKLSTGSKVVYMNVRVMEDKMVKLTIHYYPTVGNYNNGQTKIFKKNESELIPDEPLTKDQIAKMVGKSASSIAFFTTKGAFEAAMDMKQKNYGASTDGISQLDEEVTLWVIGNGSSASFKTLSSSSSSSSTKVNTIPKTGDDIYVAVTMACVSASALALAYVMSKKRRMF